MDMDIGRYLEENLETPEGGGWATLRCGVEQRLVRMSPQTLQRLKNIAAVYSKKLNMKIGPMIIASALLEVATGG